MTPFHLQPGAPLVIDGGRWLRVRRGLACPVCDRTDWCLVARDGTQAICPRVESMHRFAGAGWLHELIPTPRRDRPPGGGDVSVAIGRRETRFAALAEEYRQGASDRAVERLGGELGLTAESLRQLGVGWSAAHRAWSFPMTDGLGGVVGIRLRTAAGRKFAVAGGREGLFVVRREGSDLLLIAEGPTDAAALLDMGFPAVAGRPSCEGGVRPLEALLRATRPKSVLLVGDGDGPGRRGAERLMGRLAAFCRDVRAVYPPEAVKDAREWRKAGARRADVEERAATASAARVVVRTVAVPKGVRRG